MTLLPRSITGRLVFWLLACSAAVLIAVGMFLYGEVRNIVIFSVDRTLHSKLQIITGLLHEEHGKVELELSEIIAGEYVVPRSGHYYRVTTGGTVLAASPSLVVNDFVFAPTAPLSPDRQPDELVYTSTGPDDEPVRVLRYRHRAFDTTFDITLAESLSDSLAMIAAFKRFLLAVVPLSIAVLCLTAWRIAGTSLRPLAAFSATIEAITHRNLAERIAPGATAKELTRLARSFNEMLDRLHRVFESEKRLVADASHELRTPLSVIKAQCDVVLQRPRTPEEYLDALRTIKSSSEGAARLIHDMLSLARLDAGLISAADVTAFSLKECIEQAVQMTGQLAAERRVRVTTSIEEPLFVEGSRTGLTEAFSNLIENGIRYNKEQGAVVVAAENRDGKAVVTISDTGTGIRSGDMSRIFDRFYRAAAVRNTEGTGLGLSIVKSVVETHGGNISVESEPGRGSRFTVVLPLAGKKLEDFLEKP